MGVWDEYCLVCGGPPPRAEEGRKADFEEGEEDLYAGLKDLDWLDNYVGVLESEEVVPLGNYDGYGNFDCHDDDDPEGETVITAAHCEWKGMDEEDLGRRALTCHESCFKLLQRDLGYILRWEDVWPMLMDQQDIGKENPERWSRIRCNSFRWTDYGGIGQYLEQFFDFDKVAADGNGWMVQDPLKNERNALRIVEVWRPLLEHGFNIPDQESQMATGELSSLRV